MKKSLHSDQKSNPKAPEQRNAKQTSSKNETVQDRKQAEQTIFEFSSTVSDARAVLCCCECSHLLRFAA